MYDILIKQMRDEVTRLGAQELKTPQDVDATVPMSKGTMLVVINSTCGCAGGTARPALAKALQHSVKPGQLTTVFASTDREATARLRQIIGPEIPPSSPAFALFRDGKMVEMVHRYQIEGHTVDQVTKTLTEAFERHCTN
ncbi:MAG: BrxA/BrxB family bacilliredoxin [Bacteroidetes bacterium]|jgi:putative YphP/YqiW family bacilliredoxin|nr:BrxA/BrxB family bacilliredoxin [Bacteroidota bacterium]